MRKEVVCMFQTKKINKNTVAVAHNVINICLRYSGKLITEQKKVYLL